MFEKNYEPTMSGLEKATSDLDAALGTLSDQVKAVVMVAADEIFANVVNYSQATSWTLRVELLDDPARVRLVVEDDGTAFNPLSAATPDTSLPAEERRIGGLGIFIVRKTMNPVAYERKNGKNVLSMTKIYG